MVDLVSLSNELLVHVFSSSATLQSAASLAGVNKSLNSLWTEHNNQILANILQTNMPSYKEAAEVAIFEETWISKNTRLASVKSAKAPVRLYLAQLRRNAKLATSAMTAWEVYRKDEESFKTEAYHHSTASYLTAYYQLRKLVFIRQHPEAQLDHLIYSTLTALSPLAILILGACCCFVQADEAAYLKARASHHLAQRLPRQEEEQEQEPVRHDFAFGENFRPVCEAVIARARDLTRLMKGEKALEGKLYGANHVAV